MLFFSNLVKTVLKNCVAICFGLILLTGFVSPATGQPTGFRDLNPEQRKVLTQQKQAEIDQLAESVKKDSRNIAVYKQRVRLFFDLLELNFDNNGWDTYGEKIEEDLSRVVELEPTAASFLRRGDFRHQRLFHSPPPTTIDDYLYPRSRYFDAARSDYLEAIRLESNPQQISAVYSMLSGLYVLRPQKFMSVLSFPERRPRIVSKLVFDDLDSAIEYSRKALEIGAKQPYADGLKTNLVRIYMTAADIAVKLENYQAALGFYEASQNYLTPETSLCEYYAGWGSVYLKLKNPDKALEKFNSVAVSESAHCAELTENRGDAFAAKGEFERALKDYEKALTLDKSDSLERKGQVYLKRAKLFLQTGKAGLALDDLNVAAEKKYIAGCPSVYRMRAEVYRKLGKKDLAAKDLETAANLQKQGNCPQE